ncbi:hypothetical protein Tco_1131479, partial [Tanacetum coccineum]
MASLKILDDKIDAGQATDEEKMLRVNTWHELDNLVKLESMDLFQKACVRWDIEGDENTKFFHGIINFKRNTQMIKDNFPSMSADNRLSNEDLAQLDSMVTMEEIKNAVWDCGSQKSPGSDGFTF